MTSSPLWRGGGRIFPNSPGRKFHAEGQSQDVPRRLAAILSQLAREDRLSVSGNFAISAPKTKLVASKLKGMGFDSVLVITDSLDDNLLLASRNLPNVLVLEAQQADPVSLVRFPKVLHQGCRGQDRGDAGMSKNFNQERLLQVLVAPQISEKATYVADKNEQVVFIVTPMQPSPKSRRPWSCCSRLR
jgi:hypothetical protein